MGSRIHISENEKKTILSLYEQDQKVNAVPLTNSIIKNLDTKTKEEINRAFNQNYDIKKKLEIPSETSNDFDVLSILNKRGVTPYIFVENETGTGVKFAMIGAYVDLFGTDIKVKLHLSNVSEYLVRSLPWTLVSLSIPL